ncbi:MAG TPA: SgcJ/EcaC family oxidoreductase [Candidatus Competibacteraceae bacterium]|nr:SgcJ/EcaC family oxidoreductase [Gammaproteobacteria bacterium]HPF58935.1 SgcJ/EcaC family oxidoreductase [Candidatus Competibacteraceae bacterium]
MEEMHPVEAVIAAADDAINREDIDAVMECYAEHAVLVVRPGMHAVGKGQIRQALIAIAEHFAHTLMVEQLTMEVLDSGNTALVVALTRISAKGMEPVDRKAIYVFERGSNGRWLCTIDNSYGHELLEGVHA